MTIVSLTTTVVMSNSANTPQLNKGLIVQSDEPVQATYRLTASVNQDIIPLKGRSAPGFSFYAASQTRLRTANNLYDERHFVSVMVMATEPNTVVTFRSPIALEGVTAALNTPFSITLSEGQTYVHTQHTQQQSRCGYGPACARPPDGSAVRSRSRAEHNGQF